VIVVHEDKEIAKKIFLEKKNGMCHCYFSPERWYVVPY
jgi:hypothetical protein